MTNRVTKRNLRSRIIKRFLLGTLCLLLTWSGPIRTVVGQEPAKSESKQKSGASKRSIGTPLQKAITRGMEPDGDLSEELLALEDSSFRSTSDANFIVETLKRLPAEEKIDGMSSRLDELSSLFMDVDDESPAQKVLREKGIPELIRIFNEMGDQTDRARQNDQVGLLRIMAQFETREGAETVVAAAKKMFAEDSYYWYITMAQFGPEHPQHAYVFEELAKQLPGGDIGVALLDCANQAALEEKLETHPFDSDTGVKLLRSWLEDPDKEHADLGHSAAVALPFLKHAERDALLTVAMKHPESSVRLESAWAAGKLGLDEGFKSLANACLDVNLSMVAKEYLTELKREDLIPDAAKDPTFAARADFARWLSHPNELSEAPDEVEVVDQRELVWPPSKTASPFWLLRYRLKDKTGLEDDNENYGLVGSQTWCFFDDHMMKRPVEDVYAIHCCWEQEVNSLIDEVDVEGPDEERSLLTQWKGEQLDDAAVVTVVRMSLRLKYPSRRVAVATAEIQGQDGWVVLDGDRSQWYPSSEQPPETSEQTIWRIHVGRQLLGLTTPADRKSLLAPKPPQRTPQQFLEAYEKLLNEPLPSLTAEQENRFTAYGILGRNFEKYVEALTTVRELSKADATIFAFEVYLKLAEQSDPSIAEDVYGVSTVLSDNFLAYVDALVEKGRTSDVAALITRFTPHLDYNLGHVQLGTAAFRINDLELANTHFQWMLDAEVSDIAYWDEVGLFAEVLQKRGEDRKAKDLLIRCMAELVARVKEDEDEEFYLKPYKIHRAAYLKLYPQGQAELIRKGLVENPR